MPMSGGFQTQLPGLQLVAWALVDLGTLTVKKGFNISGISGSAGTYTLTFQNALPNTDYFVEGKGHKGQMETYSTSFGLYVTGFSTSSFNCQFLQDNMAQTTGAKYVAVYA